MGEEEEAGKRFKALHDDLLEKGRTAEAIEALKEFVRINPLEREARSTLAKTALEQGDLTGAREFLDEDSAGDDPVLLLPLAEIELRSGELARAKGLLERLMSADPSRRTVVTELGWSFIDSSPETTFTCLEAAVDGGMAAAAYEEAASTLQQFVARVPGQIPALLKLVEVCVDGGLEQPMYEAQEQLADAYLAANQAAEARVIAEDLVAREPWEAAHIDRFRRALVMLRVSDPDTLIAERLSGQAPFMAKDLFFDGAEAAAAPEPEAEETEHGEVAAAEAEVDAEVEAEASPDTLVPEPPAPVETVPPQPAPAAASGDEIDLTGALGGLDAKRGAGAAAPAGTLDQAFAQIRTDAETEGDFSSQHMTLAKTYLEIGMVDEAIASLQTAVRSPRQRFEAAAALGRVYERRGEQSLAIEWMERAAEAQAPSPEEGRQLLYDLGVLLDTAGETSRALAVFLELQSDAGDYQDVPSRIDRLARVQTGG
jgi:tetratricopeptide (TPR) repeat protein